MTALSTIRWDIDIVALSSIVHREDYSSVGTDNFALFRREKILSADGTMTEVPIVSGSSFRGVLRRIGEQHTAAILDYESTLPVPAAHLLTNGGRLAKSARPLTDEGERQLKTLLPLIAVFGGAASGRIMSGLLTVGKVLPEIAELAHILPRPPHSDPAPPAVLSVAEEPFTHLADHRPNTHQPPTQDTDETSPLGRYYVETLPAGTRLQSWIQLTNATDNEISFLATALDTFTTRGHLGGRIASGHGQIRATATPTTLRGTVPDPLPDWADALRTHRDQAISALTALT